MCHLLFIASLCCQELGQFMMFPNTALHQWHLRYAHNKIFTTNSQWKTINWKHFITSSAKGSMSCSKSINMLWQIQCVLVWRKYCGGGLDGRQISFFFRNWCLLKNFKYIFWKLLFRHKIRIFNTGIKW